MSSNKPDETSCPMEEGEANDAKEIEPGTKITFIRRAMILSSGEFPAKHLMGETNQPIRLRLTGLPSPLPTEVRFYVADRIPKNKQMSATVVMGPDADGVYACSVKYRNRKGLEKLLEVEAAKEVVVPSPFASRDVRVSEKGRSAQTSSDKEGRSAQNLSSTSDGYSTRSDHTTPWVKGRHRRHQGRATPYPAKKTIQRRKHSRRPFMCPVSGCGLVHDNPKNHLGSHVPRFMTEASEDITMATSAKRQEYLAKLCLLATQDDNLTVAINVINEAEYIRPGYSITPKLHSIMKGVAEVTQVEMPEEPIGMTPITSPLALFHTRCLLFLVSKIKRADLTALNNRYKETEVGPQVAKPAPFYKPLGASVSVSRQPLRAFRPNISKPSHSQSIVRSSCRDEQSETVLDFGRELQRLLRAVERSGKAELATGAIGILEGGVAFLRILEGNLK